jgi:UDP-N-acetyl-alpha-D-muramoyl-L-alanyl-L-glutamate epimerase
MATATELRTRHPKFSYSHSEWKVSGTTLECLFHYSIEPEIEFTHSVKFTAVSPERVAALPPALLESLVFSLGMITAFSYWKTTASPVFLVSAGKLSSEQLAWWKTLLLESMGEYFFVNDIDFTQEDFVTLISEVAAIAGVEPVVSTEAVVKTNPDADKHPALTQDPTSTPNLHLDKPFLVPIGGGKDSAVAIELLQQFIQQTKTPVIPLGSLLFQAPPAAHAIATTLSNSETVVIERTFDPLLLELNAQGYLNGHTPFSAMLAFTSVLAAVLYGYHSVVLANEHSANEGNVLFHDHEINHQYSKSFAFETAFRQYYSEHLFPGYSQQESPQYFSVLRPLYELQIGSLFAPLTQHHSLFRSCNRGQKNNSWCGECSKCLFAYLILFPFFPWETLSTLFGKDLFADISLQETARDLLGKGEKKPLECVGTYEECICAAFLSIQRYTEHSKPLPALLEWISTTLLVNEDHLSQRTSKILRNWGSEHAIPPELAQFLKKQLFSPFTHLKNKRFVVFGMGREGRSTAAFLSNTFPDQELVLVDESNILEGVQHPLAVTADTSTIIFKAPGIVPDHPSILEWLEAGATLHSNTQLFFELLTTLATPPLVIGVTGTKGKSTTTAVIAQVLKAGGKEVLLGGNIGVPPLDLWGKLSMPDADETGDETGKERAGDDEIGDETGNKEEAGDETGEKTGKEEAGDEAGDETGEPAGKLAQNLPHVVLELSAHQLADISMSPNIAVIQGITPEHLDYYPDFATYVAAKSQITRYQSSLDLVIYNSSLATPSQLAALSAGKKLSFGTSDTTVAATNTTAHTSICYELEGSIMYKNEPVIKTSALTLFGAHNVLNVMPAIIIGKELGVTTETIATALTTFTPLPHRLQLVKTVAGVEYYNDSLATTPEATLAALRGFGDRPVVLIAGGAERNLDFTALVQYLSSNNILGLVLFPPTGETIAKLLQQQHSSLPHVLVHSMDEAVAEAQKFVATHSKTNPEVERNIEYSSMPVVLLSPGSASFGLFKDYADRGDQFIAEVERL